MIQPSISLGNLFSETYFGYVKYPAGSTLGPRIQRGIEFVYLISGHIDITVDGVKQRLLPGHMALMLPGRQEHYQFHKEQPTVHAWCQLDFDQCPNDIVEGFAKLPATLPMPKDVEELMNVGLGITNSQSFANQSVLLRLAESLAQYYVDMAELPDQRRPQPTSRIVRNAIHCMQAHLSDNLQLEDLAAASHCSVNHLINQFKATVGTTPMRYLWRLRLDRAESLLRHTPLSITLISEQCGFASPFHFSRLFKQTYDLSPRQYRDNLSK